MHLSLSLHGVLFCTLAWLHCCITGSHVSVVHGLLSSQFRPMPPHLPLVHLSPVVQALPSLQIVLSALLAFAQPV